ncbi:MAG TPA: hypothetical protein VF614_09845, partial [Chthoniobacteraceae bacterium]
MNMSRDDAGVEPSSTVLPANNNAKVRTVQASMLVMHPLIGIGVDALLGRYQQEAEPELDRLRRNQGLTALIEAVPRADGKLAAVGPMSASLAALIRAREDPGCKVQVVERQALDEVAFVTRLFDPASPPTLWEQARALRSIVERAGTVRSWIK